MKIIDGKDLVNKKFILTDEGYIKEYRPQSRFIPQFDETYYYIDCFGYIDYTKNENNDCDKYILSHQLVFRTKKEAEDYKWFLDQIDNYKTDFSKEEWEDYSVSKYSLYFKYGEHKIGKGFNCNTKSHCYYFTEENIDKFIEVVGEERIKKYMFDIWE